MSQGVMWAVMAAVLWGAIYRIDERVMQFLTPYQLYFLHSLTGLVIGVILVLLNRESAPKAPMSRNDLVWIILTVLTYSVANIAILHSIKLLAAHRSAALEISYPIFVVVFGVLVLRDPLPNIWFLLGVALIFAGSLLVITKS